MRHLSILNYLEINLSLYVVSKYAYIHLYTHIFLHVNCYKFVYFLITQVTHTITRAKYKNKHTHTHTQTSNAVVKILCKRDFMQENNCKQDFFQLNFVYLSKRGKTTLQGR